MTDQYVIYESGKIWCNTSNVEYNRQRLVAKQETNKCEIKY